jgi:peptidyl-prolyl cis-trans isomerase D
VLQQMRSLAKYVWLLVALAFVGGFLLVETSGLLGRTAITPTTAVATVNGRDILYTDYLARVQQQIQQEQQRNSGRSLTQDDDRRIENDVFDQMVMEVLLSQEYQRRRIIVTDDEIRMYAREQPPDWITNQPELQTNGQFDINKYHRYLSSSYAKQSNLLFGLEQYYRSEIPRQKLFDQIAASIYVSDADLWRTWRDQNDSVAASFVAFRPAADPAAAKGISDADLHAYFDKHKSEFQHPGRAIVSVLEIPRTVTAADTETAKAKAIALRNEILKGAKFEDVANRESADTTGGKNGGVLPRGGKNRFVPEFEKAAYALKVGELSQPVLTPFGFHIIRVDEHKGDTLALRHILVPITASDSATSRVDRKADSLANLAGSSDDATKFDAAAKKLGLTPIRVVALEDQPAQAGGRTVPSVSAWAFGGARPGETSDLFDDDNGYYLARLDSLQPGAKDNPGFESVKEDVRVRVARQRELDNLMKPASDFAVAASASGFDAAAAARKLQVQHAPPFTRASFVPGIGQVNEAVGAAFGLPVNAVSAPVRTDDAVFVLHIDRRVNADSAAWLGQKSVQRQQRLSGMRQQAVQLYLQDLKASAKIDDRRKALNAAARRQAT